MSKSDIGFSEYELIRIYLNQQLASLQDEIAQVYLFLKIAFVSLLVISLATIGATVSLAKRTASLEKEKATHVESEDVPETSAEEVR